MVCMLLQYVLAIGSYVLHIIGWLLVSIQHGIVFHSPRMEPAWGSFRAPFGNKKSYSNGTCSPEAKARDITAHAQTHTHTQREKGSDSNPVTLAVVRILAVPLILLVCHEYLFDFRFQLVLALYLPRYIYIYSISIYIYIYPGGQRLYSSDADAHTFASLCCSLYTLYLFKLTVATGRTQSSLPRLHNRIGTCTLQLVWRWRGWVSRNSPWSSAHLCSAGECPCSWLLQQALCCREPSQPWDLHPCRRGSSALKIPLLSSSTPSSRSCKMFSWTFEGSRRFAGCSWASLPCSPWRGCAGGSHWLSRPASPLPSASQVLAHSHSEAPSPRWMLWLPKPPSRQHKATSHPWRAGGRGLRWKLGLSLPFPTAHSAQSSLLGLPLVRPLHWRATPHPPPPAPASLSAPAPARRLRWRSSCCFSQHPTEGGVRRRGDEGLNLSSGHTLRRRRCHPWATGRRGSASLSGSATKCWPFL